MEVWKDIAEFEGIYQVSNVGRIKSLGRIIIRNKTGMIVLNDKILSPHIDKVGYPRVVLFKKNFNRRVNVHRLVAETFIENTHCKPNVNHKNSIRHDNRVDNLEWCTQSENIRHAYLNNRISLIYGEKSTNAKLTNEKVLEIRRLMSEGAVRKTVAEKFGVSASSIRLIVKRINWAHI